MVSHLVIWVGTVTLESLLQNSRPRRQRAPQCRVSQVPDLELRVRKERPLLGRLAWTRARASRPPRSRSALWGTRVGMPGISCAEGFSEWEPEGRLKGAVCELHLGKSLGL